MFAQQYPWAMSKGCCAKKCNPAADKAHTPGAQMIRILVVDDYADFRLVCVLMLHRQPELEVVAQAGSPAEAPTML